MSIDLPLRSIMANVYKIGILEVQGAFHEHKQALMKARKYLNDDIQLQICEVRHPDHIKDELDGLIIPGGESTAISLFMKRNSMEEPLRQWIQGDHHVTWGTCAGMILLANETENQKEDGQPSLGGLDVVVSRNYFGRQVNSFEAIIELLDESLYSETNELERSFRGVFIRAPAVTAVNSPAVKVLANVDSADKTVAVAVQQDKVLATAFHPELTDDPRWHLHFLKMIQNIKHQH